MHGPNTWPLIPGWEPSIRTYFHDMLQLSKAVARGVALSLNLPETFFDDKMRDPVAQLLLLKYPPPPAQQATAGNCHQQQQDSQKMPGERGPGSASFNIYVSTGGNSNASQANSSAGGALAATEGTEDQAAAEAAAAAAASTDSAAGQGEYVGCGAHTDCGFLTILAQVGSQDFAQVI
jgi:isopenicillin N synthase-like dioxygenase